MTKTLFIARKLLIAATSFVVLVLFGQNCSNGFAPTLYLDHFASNGANASAEFKAAKAIIQNNCTTCHSGSGSQSFARLDLSSENQFVLGGWVLAGKPDESKLIQRLKNYGSSPINDMPPNRRLSDSDFQTLRRWILAIGSSSQPDSGAFTCNDTAPFIDKVVATPVQPLSTLQYTNTLKDFLRTATSSWQTIYDYSVANVIIPEESSARYLRTVNQLSRERLQAFFNIADSVANQLTTEASAATFLTRIINLNRGACVGESLTMLSQDCAKQFIRNLGLRVYRRPLTEGAGAGENELEEFMKEFTLESNKSQALNNLVMRMMLSQNFLFQMEDSGVRSPVNPNLVQLSSYALANRLSYTFWNTMPDQTLFNMARDKNLQEDLNFIAALNYVLSDAKVESSLKEFAYGWLLLNKIPNFHPTTDSLKHFNDGITFDYRMGPAMRAEAQDLVSYITRTDGTLADIFTTDLSFAREPLLMQVYGVTTAAPKDLVAAPMQIPRMPAGTRAGILTRGALLAEASGAQHLIHRAVRIKRDLLCISQAAAPADLTPPVPLTDQQYESYTYRQRFAHNTGSGSCVSCHQSINPWGYPLSRYNGLGFYKMTEPAFRKDGTLTSTQLPTDPTSDLTGLVSGGGPINDAIEYSAFIATRPETQTCFTKNYVHYFLGRQPDSVKDGCRLSKMNNMIKAGTLKDAISSIATDIEFRHRKLD